MKVTHTKPALKKPTKTKGFTPAKIEHTAPDEETKNIEEEAEPLGANFA